MGPEASCRSGLLGSMTALSGEVEEEAFTGEGASLLLLSLNDIHRSHVLNIGTEAGTGVQC